MKKIKFERKIDLQRDDLKEFITSIKNKTKIKTVFEIGGEITMNEVQQEVQKLNEVLPETINLEFSLIVVEKLDKNAMIITLFAE